MDKNTETQRNKLTSIDIYIQSCWRERSIEDIITDTKN